MPRISLDRPDLKLDPDDPPGFRPAVWRFGESLGGLAGRHDALRAPARAGGMPCVASLRQRIAGTEGVRALRYVAESERLLAPTQPTR